MGGWREAAMEEEAGMVAGITFHLPYTNEGGKVEVSTWNHLIRTVSERGGPTSPLPPPLPGNP